MSDEIVIDVSNRSPSCWSRLVWQEMFNLYRKHGGDLDEMDNLLIDYDTIKKLIDGTWTGFPHSFKIVWGFGSHGLTNIYFDNCADATGWYTDDYAYLIEYDRDKQTVKITFIITIQHKENIFDNIIQHKENIIENIIQHKENIIENIIKIIPKTNNNYNNYMITNEKIDDTSGKCQGPDLLGCRYNSDAVMTCKPGVYQMSLCYQCANQLNQLGYQCEEQNNS